MKLIATTAALLVASTGLTFAAVKADALTGLMGAEGLKGAATAGVGAQAGFVQLADAGLLRGFERPIGGWRWGDDRRGDRDDRWGDRDDRDDRDDDRDDRDDDRGDDRDDDRGDRGGDRGADRDGDDD